jgi:hypothetical protein
MIWNKGETDGEHAVDVLRFLTKLRRAVASD